MRLWITRHGKTQWNVEGRFQGALDSPLVSSGIEDAKTLHDYLLHESFDAVYTSPLGRAKATAALIFDGRNDITIKEDDRLQEMNFGIFEGMRTQDIFEKYATLYDNLWNHPEKFTRCPNGGESFLEVRERIVSFLAMLKTHPEMENIFLVTHGMYFICLLGYFMGYEPKDFPKINRHVVRGCSLTRVDIIAENVQILSVGDDHFLKPAKQDSFLIQQKKM